VDSRVIRMALDAQAFHNMKAEQAKAIAKPAPAPKPAPSPVTVKPGARGMQSASSAAYTQAREALSKTGRVDAATAVFKARFGQTKR
jgi:hypothetical protein